MHDNQLELVVGSCWKSNEWAFPYICYLPCQLLTTYLFRSGLLLLGHVTPLLTFYLCYSMLWVDCCTSMAQNWAKSLAQFQYNLCPWIKMHIYPSTCPFLYSSNFLLFIINPQHHPLIKYIPTKDILFAIVQSLAQRKSATTNHNKSNLSSSETNDERKKTCLHYFQILPLILSSTALLSKPPFNVVASLAIHSSVLINST